MECVAEVLELELKTFEEKRLTLLAEHEGKFVLIKGDQIIGTFESQQDAIAVGYREFGNVAFLVKQISPSDIPINILTPFLAA
jgi:hypothetical protein